MTHLFPPLRSRQQVPNRLTRAPVLGNLLVSIRRIVNVNGWRLILKNLLLLGRALLVAKLAVKNRRTTLL